MVQLIVGKKGKGKTAVRQSKCRGKNRKRKYRVY